MKIFQGAEQKHVAVQLLAQHSMSHVRVMTNVELLEHRVPELQKSDESVVESVEPMRTNSDLARLDQLKDLSDDLQHFRGGNREQFSEREYRSSRRHFTAPVSNGQVKKLLTNEGTERSYFGSNL